jgi:hypothetical protein
LFEINSKDDHILCKVDDPPQPQTTTNSEEIVSKSNSYEFINLLNEDSSRDKADGACKKQRKQRSDKNKRRKHPHRKVSVEKLGNT